MFSLVFKSSLPSTPNKSFIFIPYRSNQKNTAQSTVKICDLQRKQESKKKKKKIQFLHAKYKMYKIKKRSDLAEARPIT